MFDGYEVQLIAFLADLITLNQHGDGDGDTDTLRVPTALNFTNKGQSVMVMAEDTDISIMLIHHWKTDMADMYFRQKYTE